MELLKVEIRQAIAGGDLPKAIDRLEQGRTSGNRRR